MAEITIPLRSHDEAILVLGPYDRNAKLLRKALDIEVYTRGGNLRLKGADGEIGEAQRRVEHLLGKLRKGRELEPREVEEILIGPRASDEPERAVEVERTPRRSSIPIPSRGEGGSGRRMKAIEPRGANQRAYLEAIESNTLTFGVGAAGTGKTFLAVAAAVRRLRSGQCRRLVITRPVVEAGEHLGFLPGDVQAKLNPYMRPVYDALYEMIGFDETSRLEEAGVIEVAPLAFMRGRTLGDCFVILDEAQNVTREQMKMFLTRCGFNSKVVVTGDITQIDLPAGKPSGLVEVQHMLSSIDEIGFVYFDDRDVVRHPLVQSIIKAYENNNNGNEYPEPSPRVP
jgi:phosphate starvation-inducible PhoH-like protein